MKIVEIGAAAVMLACAILCNSPVTRAAEVAADSPRQPFLARHVPEPVASGALTAVSPVDPQQRMQLSVALPLTHQAQMTQLLHDLYDRSSPKFHQFLGVDEFTERFSATQADYDAVVSWATANGFTVTSTSRNRRLVAVEGSVDTINRTFHVTMTHYRHPVENRTFHSADREPTITGLNVPLLQVTGLDDYVLPHTLLKQSAASVKPGLTGSGPSGYYLPSDMRAAYYGNGWLDGLDQQVAVISFNGYLVSDLNLYYSTTGMSASATVDFFAVNGFGNYSNVCTTVGQPSGYTGSCFDGEQILDIVNVIGMAPNLDLLWFVAGNDAAQILNFLADNGGVVQDGPTVATSSWLWGSSEAATDDTIFQELQAQGVTFLQASGDGGAFGGTSSWGTSYQYPADDPYITVVGGTDLTTTGPGGSWVSETAWADSGGGYVSGISIPSWQQQSGVINASNGGSTSWRNAPDVAAEANFDNVTVNDGTFLVGVGGTSFAAPRWAGYLALFNELLVYYSGNFIPSTGFINPTLYSSSMATGANYSSIFHDITSGSNPSIGESGFNAVTGYDLVTGWGSPNAGFMNAFLNAYGEQQ